MPTTDSLRLRTLGLGARAGLTCLVLVLLGGYVVAAGAHLVAHHENRDGQAGLSMTDLEGAYHGVNNPSRFLVALERNHPPDMPAAERALLLEWLRGDRISEDYDSIDLGASAPAEIIDRRCLDCHAGSAADGAGIRLQSWSDVRQVAFSNEIAPVDRQILLASTHAHAPTMAAITIVLTLLALLTSWPRWLVGTLVLLAGASLLADLGSWWLARDAAGFVAVIAGAGLVHSGSAALLMLAVLVDLWMPRPRAT